MHDPALQAFLDTVGKRVVANRPIPENVDFRFRAVRDPMVKRLRAAERKRFM